MAASSAHPSLVLAAYLEPLVVGRRVVVLGDASLGLAEELFDRGARLVHAYDPDPARISEALARQEQGVPGPSYAVLAGDVGTRDGAFDVAVVPDLSLFEVAAETLRRARRMVGTGIAVVSSPNPAAPRRLVTPPPAGQRGAPLGYYELFDAVSVEFTRVKMLGQAPFVGYTVADFAPEGEPDVSVDTSLLDGSEEPEAFLAIGSERATNVEPYAVVELPLEAVVEALDASEHATTLRGPDRHALTEAQTRLALVTAELESMRDRAREHAKDGEARASKTAALSARVMELEGQLEITALRAKDVDARAGDAQVRADRLGHQVTDLEEELRRQRERAVGLSRQVDDEKRARQKAEIELGMIKGRAEAPGAKERVDALTTELGAARSRIVELEAAEATTLRRMASAEQVEMANAKAAALAGELDAERRSRASMAEEIRRHGEAIAARDAKIAAGKARVDELERRLTAAASAAASDAASADVNALEQRLVERGHALRALQKDLRETERVGRELLAELEELQGAGLEPSPPSTPDGAAGSSPATSDGADYELRARLDVLSASAARAEADLQAAGWKITQLERELAEARRAPRTAETVHTELEQALVAARDEVAALRRAMAAEGTAPA